MTIYMVHTYRLTMQHGPLGQQEHREPLGNVIFENDEDAQLHADNCRAHGLDATVQPRVVIPKAVKGKP